MSAEPTATHLNVPRTIKVIYNTGYPVSCTAVDDELVYLILSS